MVSGQLLTGRGVDFIYYLKKLLIQRDIGHRFAVMCKADITFGIDDAIQRHSSQLEEIHFLPVYPCYGMARVRQADKRNLLIHPILLEHGQCIRTDSQNFHAAVFELFVSIPQARQLRAAVRSHKAAQKCQYNRLAAQAG